MRTGSVDSQTGQTTGIGEVLRTGANRAWHMAVGLLLAGTIALLLALAVLFLGGCGSGTSPPPARATPDNASLLYVAGTGNDANPGTAEAPLLTLPAAIAAGAARIAAGEARPVHVRVAAGTYAVNSDAAVGTHLVLSEGVSLYGGYASDWSARDPVAQETIIADGGTDTGNNLSPNRVLAADSTITTATVVDGFTIRGAAGGYAYGLYLAGAPTVRACRIDGGTATVVTTGVYIDGAAPRLEGNTITAGTAPQNYGVQVQNGATPTLAGNDMRGGGGSLSFALMTFNAAPVLTGNTLYGGTATQSRGLQNSNGTPSITANTIHGGDAGNQSVAVLNANGSGTAILRNNVILGGSASQTTRGISVESGAHPIIQHNTIDGGTAGLVAYAVVLVGGSGGTIQNNLLFTSGGTTRICLGEAANADEPDAFQNNALFDCATALYQDNEGTPVNQTAIGGAVTVGTTTDTLTNLGNVAEAAVFVGATDWHLEATTPAGITAGGMNLTDVVPTDKAGLLRSLPVSMGAYER